MDTRSKRSLSIIPIVATAISMGVWQNSFPAAVTVFFGLVAISWIANAALYSAVNHILEKVERK